MDNNRERARNITCGGHLLICSVLLWYVDFFFSYFRYAYDSSVCEVLMLWANAFSLSRYTHEFSLVNIQHSDQ